MTFLGDGSDKMTSLNLFLASFLIAAKDVARDKEAPLSGYLGGETFLEDSGTGAVTAYIIDFMS